MSSTVKSTVVVYAAITTWWVTRSPLWTRWTPARPCGWPWGWNPRLQLPRSKAGLPGSL